MNTRKIFTIVSLFAAFAANAQITLIKDNVTTNTTATEKEQLVVFPGVAIPHGGANIQWDYSGMVRLTAGHIDSTTFMAPLDTVLHATRAYAQSTILAQSVSNLIIHSSVYLANDIYGYGYVGYSIDTRKSFTLNGAIGGFTANDSLIIPVQDSVYKARQFILQYPATYGSTWSFSGNIYYHFLLDLPTLNPAYVNLYGTHTITRKVTDTVIGWGTLQVPIYNTLVSVPSQPYSVLLVKEDVMDIANISVSGMSTTDFATLVAGLSIKQGDTTITSTYLFYRAGTANPLMFYEVDPSAGYDPDNTVQTGIEDKNAIINFAAYPNPVTQSNLNFVFNKPDNKEWMMTITNETGQIVQSVPVNQLAGPVQLEINLTPTLANGIYFYNMNNGSNAVNGKFILNR